VVLKRDARGRVRTTAAQRVALLAEYERSGLSGPTFARVTGINYQTFAWWRQERRKAHSALMPATQPVSIRLVEATLPATPPLAVANAAVKVVLPGGGCVEISHVGQVALVAELLKTLA
jgi:transposase-like protein